MNEPNGMSNQSLETIVEHFLNAVITSVSEADTTLNGALNGALHNSFLEINPYKQVLSEEGKQQLRNVTFCADMKNTHCPITLEEFNVGDDVIALPCEHVFNKESIQKWLTEEKSVCPLCRYELKSKLIKQPNEQPNELTELVASQNRLAPPVRTAANGRSFAESIIQRIMSQQIQDEEEEMVHIAIQNSLLPNVPCDTSVNDI